jgi:hypothetical protein
MIPAHHVGEPYSLLMSPSPTSLVKLFSRARYIGSSTSKPLAPVNVDFELAQSGEKYELRWRATDASNSVSVTKNASFLSKKTNEGLKDVVLAMDSVFGATCASSLPPLNASLSASLGVSTSSPSKILLIHTLEYSSDPAVRYKKGYKYVWHAFETEPTEAMDWARTITSLARGEPGLDLSKPSQKPRVLVVINPFAGTKSAPKVYKETVRPMLSLAGFQVEEKDTEYGGHANEIIAGLDASDLYEMEGHRKPYERIVTVSGDGVFHEVIQGIFARPDWARVISSVRLGIVSGGSANALARNIGEGSNVLGVLRGIISGRTTDLSLMAMTQHTPSGQRTWYSHLELLWGFPADADIESERQRWAGYGGLSERGNESVNRYKVCFTARVAVQALIRLVRLREYSGTLFWLEEVCMVSFSLIQQPDTD